jgi:hypothetical protein
MRRENGLESKAIGARMASESIRDGLLSSVSGPCGSVPTAQSGIDPRSTAIHHDEALDHDAGVIIYFERRVSELGTQLGAAPEQLVIRSPGSERGMSLAFVQDVLHRYVGEPNNLDAGATQDCDGVVVRVHERRQGPKHREGFETPVTFDEQARGGGLSAV